MRATCPPRATPCASCSTTSWSRFPSLRPQLVEDDEIAPFVNVYVEGEDVRTLDGLDTSVDHGSTVILLPAMAGGL